MSNYDHDIQWLIDQRIGATLAQQDEFSERVSIMISDAGLSVDDARVKALEGMK